MTRRNWIFAAMVGGGLAASAAGVSATGLETMLSPADAHKLLASYCIDTDAKAAKAEALVTALKLPAQAIELKQVRGGIELKLDLGAGGRLELDMGADGIVSACTLKARVADSAGTFAALQKAYQLGGNLENYEPGNKEWTDLVSPGGKPLSALVSFSAAAAGGAGTMTAIIMPRN